MADPALVLYTRGEPSDTFTLILQGKVLIRTGAGLHCSPLPHALFTLDCPVAVSLSTLRNGWEWVLCLPHLLQRHMLTITTLLLALWVSVLVGLG